MTHFIRLALLSLALAFSTGLFAAPDAAAAPPAAPAAPAYNTTLIALVSIALVLMLAMGALGNVLKSLALLHMDKIKKDRTAGRAAKVAALLLIGFLAGGTAVADEAVNAAAATVEVAPKFIAGIPRFEFQMLIGLIGFEVLAIIAMAAIVNGLLKALRAVPEKAVVAKAILKKNYLDIFNKSVAIDKEKDILLDHEYDGIHELDNSLPPWWKWGFAFTILFSGIYLWHYHAGSGLNSHEEYLAEVKIAEEEKAAYLANAANNVDENTVKMLAEANEIASGARLFAASCAACHAPDGGGGVGPNLADDYWLHGGSIKDVFTSVKYGWPDKGMKSWKDDFSPRQIAEISSYIKTLKGSKPAAPKAPQGDLFVESGAPTEAAPTAQADAAPKPISSTATARAHAGL